MIKYLSHPRPGRFWFIASLLVFLCAISGPVTAGAQDPAVNEPTATVKELQIGLLRLSETADDVSFTARFQMCADFVQKTHDLAYMAKLALGRNWQTLEKAEQEEFMALFIKLTITTYVTRFGAVHNLRFGAPEQRELARGLVGVRSGLIRPNSEMISMSYVLHRSGGKFRIINIMAKGVSELILKRSQYQQILTTSDFTALVHYIEAKIVNLKAA